MQDKKQPNIPPLRFAGFTQEWEEKKLGEIGVTYTGLSGKSKQDFGHGNATFITYLNVYVNPLANKLGVDKVEIDQSQNEVKSGDILFTTSSETPEEVGMSSVWLYDTPNTYLNSFCFGYRPSININPYFSASLFRSPGVREDFKLLAQGISRFNISKQKAMELEVSLPSLGEQEQIGAFFRALDELIEAKEEELEKLRQMKVALLEAMFPNDKNQINVNGGGKYIDIKTLPEGLYLSEGSADTPRIRFRGFTEPWQRKKLGEVAEVAMCKRVLKHQTSEQGDVPFFKIGTFGATPDAYIPYALFYELKEKFHYPKKGDLLISAAGTVGRIVEFTGEEQYFQDSNIVWLEFNRSIDNQYLKAIYAIIKWQGLEGSTLKRLYNNNILRTEIPFPSLAEQDRIGEFFRSQDEGIAAAGEQIERLKAMKQACLERMFA